MYVSEVGLVKLENALKFMLAGKSDFIAISEKTGAKLEFKLYQKKTESTQHVNNELEYIYYLSSKINGEMVYCGVIYFNQQTDKFEFKTGIKGKVQAEHKNVMSILYVLNNLLRKAYNTLAVTIYHVGKCGKCGRKLTTPESILTGLGEVCSKKCGIPRVKVATKKQ